MQSFTATIRYLGGRRLVVVAEEYSGAKDFKDHEIPEEFRKDNTKVTMFLDTSSGKDVYTFEKRE